MVLPTAVSKIDPKVHTAAAAAFSTAVDTQAQLYRAQALLGDNRQALEPFSVAGLVSDRPVPGATDRWNTAVQRYREQASKAHDAGLRAFELGEASLAKTTDSLEKQISGKLTVPLDPSVKQELRQYVAAKGKDSEHGASMALMGLINQGDLAALTAVRGAPSFLSGLSNDQINMAAELAANRHVPDLVVQRDTVASLRKVIATGRDVLLHQFTDGMTYAKPIESTRAVAFSDQPRTKK